MGHTRAHLSFGLTNPYSTTPEHGIAFLQPRRGSAPSGFHLSRWPWPGRGRKPGN
jgi:hypothetical protein